MPFISAIIPAYNGVSRYLEQSIASVLEQTFRDVELIVVDDASTDRTDRLVLSHPAARYLRRTVNGGQAAARNDGARLAAGQFLAFLDQDDLWEPTFLETMRIAADTNPRAAIIHADGYQVNEANEIQSYDAAIKQTRSITQLLRGGHDAATSGALFRKSCFDAVGGYDEELVIWEDIDLAIRLYQRYPLLHVPRPLYRHRLYGHNVSRDIASDRALLGRRRFLEKHAPLCQPGTPAADALRKDWAHYYRDFGKHCLRQDRLHEARRAFRLALQHDPWHVKSALRLLRSYLMPRS